MARFEVKLNPVAASQYVALASRPAQQAEVAAALDALAAEPEPAEAEHFDEYAVLTVAGYFIAYRVEGDLVLVDYIEWDPSAGPMR